MFLFEAFSPPPLAKCKHTYSELIYIQLQNYWYPLNKPAKKIKSLVNIVVVEKNGILLQLRNMFVYFSLLASFRTVAHPAS